MTSKTSSPRQNWCGGHLRYPPETLSFGEDDSVIDRWGVWSDHAVTSNGL